MFSNLRQALVRNSLALCFCVSACCWDRLVRARAFSREFQCGETVAEHWQWVRSTFSHSRPISDSRLKQQLSGKRRSQCRISNLDANPFLAGLEEGYLERDAVEKMASGVCSSEGLIMLMERQSYSAESAINTARAAFKELF